MKLRGLMAILNRPKIAPHGTAFAAVRDLQAIRTTLDTLTRASHDLGQPSPRCHLGADRYRLFGARDYGQP
jgi:hypothetical protein